MRSKQITIVVFSTILCGMFAKVCEKVIVEGFSIAAFVSSGTVPTVEQLKTETELLHQLVRDDIQLHRDRPQWQQSLSKLDDEIVRLQQRIDQLHQPTDPSVLSEIETELQNLRHQLQSTIGNANHNQVALDNLKTECEELKWLIRAEIKELVSQGKANLTHGLEKLEEEVILIAKEAKNLDLGTESGKNLLNDYKNVVQDLKLTLKDEIRKAHETASVGQTRDRLKSECERLKTLTVSEMSHLKSKGQSTDRLEMLLSRVLEQETKLYQVGLPDSEIEKIDLKVIEIILK